MRNDKSRDISGKVGIAASQYGKEGDYWLKKFSGELKKSTFPYDYPKSKLEQEKPGTVNITFPSRCVSKIMELSKGLEHRVYILLTAGLAALLYKYTGNSDIIIGSPIFKQDTEGDFINTILALRVQVQDSMTFKELLLDRVRPTVVEASQHQNYPLETLLYQLNMPVSPYHFPLFDVVILLENIHEKRYIRHTHPNVVFSFLYRRDSSEITGVMEYNTFRYQRNTAERISVHFTSLMERLLVNIDIPLSGVDMLREEERRQLLVDFNATRTMYPAERTIDELFRQQVSRKPDEIAVTYEGSPLTYRELDQESDRLAAYLHLMGVRTGEPVGLMAENSYRVIAALLGILKAGAAYLPINVDYPDERKKFILKDCHAKILLTRCQNIPDYNFVSLMIDLENKDIYQHKKDLPAEHRSDSLAYIMYTSGSTGTPKGVMVEHKSVVRLVRNTNFIEFNEGDSILLTGALEFDASTFEIWGALLNGLTLHLASKDTILLPHSLKEAVRQNSISTMWMTAPLFNQMVDADIEIFNGLQQLVVGGDVLSPKHIGRVRKRFPALTVINGYGPTENTTFSTTLRLDKEYEVNIPIGKPISNSTAYILDRWYGLVPIGVIGEIYLGGDGLSRGYLNNQQLTREKFIPNPFVSDGDSVPGGGRLYATGDLGRWLPGGTIEFLGRNDQQAKIRGYRIEPGEIENCLMSHDSIAEAVVVVQENKDKEKYLCAYLVMAKTLKKEPDTLDISGLRENLLEQLPDYLVPDYFVPLNEIPLNPNGKVDREALPKPEIAGTGAAYMAPRNPVEEKLAEIWARVLKADQAVIGIDSDFFELGGHSLKATILLAKIHEAFNVKLPLAELFQAPTIRELAEYIKSIGPLTKDKFSPIEPTEEKEYYRLSSPQIRLYVLQQLDPAATAYNIPQVIRLEGELEKGQPEATFKKLIQRHESIRTSFKVVNEVPVQVIHPNVDFKINSYNSNTRHQAIEELLENFVKPFDLSQAPLLRVELIKEEEKKYILMVDMHHIIIDGTSMDLFVKEFMEINADNDLSPLKLQYKDYCEWLNREEKEGSLRQQEKFWLKKFEKEIPVLNLPTDYERPPIQSFSGGRVNFEMGNEDARSLRKMAGEEGVTLYMIILTIFYILLAKLRGQDDIIVGTDVANRQHANLENVMGMFVNALALRNTPKGTKTFWEFLKDVKKQTLGAFENQNYPFELLVEKVVLMRDQSRNPLFDVYFAFQDFTGTNHETSQESSENAAFKVTPLKLNTGTTKFDLLLHCTETGRRLTFVFEYCTKLLKKETLHHCANFFMEIVSTVVKNRDIQLQDIAIDHALVKINANIFKDKQSEFEF
jgi:amino acid adenylation domain-containing protein